ncbi:hypothetical protein ACFFMN_36425 [Planobispora siamensis]|uniref:Uncharacterized protein n=1 Tax=Planobispora siamensis TaxID=936338 RepID=A0A8J3WMT2_9ACTN|nr:hypothetical protein [Planobispora siamensis]GIH96844.1 hypothetical protein Psi01_74740 [Planobispora siamensis]
MRTVARGLLLAGVLTAGVLTAGVPAALSTAAPAAEARAGAAAQAARDYDLGTIRSSRKHSGHAKAKLWITSFSEKHFQAYGSLYDLDRHPGHCASIRATFHYLEGGAGRSPERRFCASHGRSRVGYLFESKGEIRSVDLRICVADGRRGPVSHCRTETVRDEDLAW